MAVELVYKEEAYAIVGACFEVYNEMGCGFLEAVYHECLHSELQQRGIPFQPKVELRLMYKGVQLNQCYFPDFVCHEKIVLEIKAIIQLANEHRTQVHNYLKATGYRLGLLINFGHHPNLEYERIVR